MAVRLPALAQRTKANYDKLFCGCWFHQFHYYILSLYNNRLNTSNCTTVSSYRTTLPSYLTTVPSTVPGTIPRTVPPYHRTLPSYHLPYLVPYLVPPLSKHLIVPYVEVRLRYVTTAILNLANIYIYILYINDIMRGRVSWENHLQMGHVPWLGYITKGYGYQQPIKPLLP